MIVLVVMGGMAAVIMGAEAVASLRACGRPGSAVEEPWTAGLYAAGAFVVGMLTLAGASFL